MFAKYYRLCKPAQIYAQFKSKVNTQPKEKWDIITSVCLERKPVISQLLNELEATFQKYLLQIEFNRSLKSNHEIRLENDQKQESLMKHDKVNVDLDNIAVQTGQDFEDACNDELSKFVFTERITEADKQRNTKSLERKLDKYLILVTKQKIGDRSYFLPPQTKRLEGETLRQAAQRLLVETCGNELKLQIYGNAPVAFYKYKYPKQLQIDGIVGAKIFIYFARYLKGQITTNIEYKWLERTELHKEIPVEYYKRLSSMLIDDFSESEN